jgi:unsaturated chondroitin disaccharide hydrolase
VPQYRTLALTAAYAVRLMAMGATGMMPIGTQVQVRSMTLSKKDKICVHNMHPNLCLDW